ncbi:uncharacterized protein K02A2.6-like [Dendronephthya gigantea]|uniref:uncharacterized protein K02A2.6-like n=1 Tax=Dendronephthya gigantea TaxID=151771 RepID=UPI001069CBD3|nr:uncharacterized protein K02A2.6-like [Dendronephthya gigantea]
MIVKEDLTPLLGARVIQQMGLVEIHIEKFEQVVGMGIKDTPKGACRDLVKEYDDVLTGELGTLYGEQHLEVDPSVTPTVSPSRRVPFAVKPKLKAELDRLADLGVITLVDEPTDWVSNLVIATKESGDIRLCIDPKQLNGALKRERYPIPVIDDVLPDLAKAKVFTKVDARNGYWHVQLDEPSSRLTTFDTPFGRYRWKRLPFGICAASEIFQKRLNQALDRLDGLLTVHDDMVIYGVGETEEEAIVDHNTKLEGFFQRCRKTGIKLNKKKLMLLCKEIPYLGHLVTKDGLKPDPEKVEAVLKMPRPENVKAVRRFCGFVNYLSKFMPHLADVMKPLQQLTHKDAQWQWNHEHDAAFGKLKLMISNAPVLKFYHPEDELTVQCDASERGLGATLMQRGQPIAFASRTLTDPETRYAQIEKEMLAVIYAMQKFDQYVYGRFVTVESDHKPLESIVRKPLRSAPKRLQGMLLKMEKYEVNIVYKPGKEMYLADTLSRAPLNCSRNVQEEFERVNAVKSLPMSPERLEAIRKGVEADEVLQQLKLMILQGWPEEKQSLPTILTPYFSFRDELSVYDGLVFKGERLIIPKESRKQMLAEIHSSHIGINGCLRRARECIFWPGMTAEIKAKVATCETCQECPMKQQQKETLMNHELAHRPWEKVAADIFTVTGKDYLILVDYYSNFWEINRLLNTKASTCIRKIKSHFAQNVIPDVLVSDNGPQFSAEKFAKFTKEWGIEHRTSSPGHQQANGKAEAAVKMAKSLIRKAEASKGDIYLAILAQRNTPTEDFESSPAQRLLGRRCKTLLPTTTALLKPQALSRENVLKEGRAKQEKQAHYYNKSAQDLPTLEEGDVVRMRPFTMNKKTWEKATVARRLDERSFEVETPAMNYRRNRVDLKRTDETYMTDDVNNEVLNQERESIEKSRPNTRSVKKAKESVEVSSTEKTGGEDVSNEQRQGNEVMSKSVNPRPPVEVRSRPKRTTREPAYLKDYDRR